MADNTTLTATQRVNQASPGMSGKIVYDATAITAADHTSVETGFQPTRVKWVCTNGVQIEWFEGMSANTCIKTAATGARTLETTNGGITVNERGFRVLQNATLAAVVASQSVYWEADS